MQNYSWDEYFMTLAYLISMKSKDPSTRVGAVIVGVDNEVRATGYNGLPRYIMDHEERYQNKEFKYLAINHAEENAILQCARTGVPGKNCRIYVPWIPCCSCTKAILQAGIIEVIYDAHFPGNIPGNQQNWAESIKIAQQLMEEAKVMLRPFDGRIIHPVGLYKEQPYDIYLNRH